MSVNEILTVGYRNGKTTKYSYGGEMAAEWYGIDDEYADKEKVMSEFNKYYTMNDMYPLFAGSVAGAVNTTSGNVAKQNNAANTTNNYIKLSHELVDIYKELKPDTNSLGYGLKSGYGLNIPHPELYTQGFKFDLQGKLWIYGASDGGGVERKCIDILTSINDYDSYEYSYGITGDHYIKNNAKIDKSTFDDILNQFKSMMDMYIE